VHLYPGEWYRGYFLRHIPRVKQAVRHVSAYWAIITELNTDRILIHTFQAIPATISTVPRPGIKTDTLCYISVAVNNKVGGNLALGIIKPVERSAHGAAGGVVENNKSLGQKTVVMG
jgi:hypothetical protein